MWVKLSYKLRLRYKYSVFWDSNFFFLLVHILALDSPI